MTRLEVIYRYVILYNIYNAIYIIENSSGVELKFIVMMGGYVLETKVLNELKMRVVWGILKVEK